MDNSTYSGFAPINYTESSDHYICNTDNYAYNDNLTDTINNIDRNIKNNKIKVDENNKLFEIKKDLLKYLKNDIDDIEILLQNNGSEIKEKEINKDEKTDYIGKTLIEEFDNFIKYFDLKQKKLLESENKFINEIRKNKEDVAQIDSLMKYYDHLNKKYENGDKTIENMEKLAINIKENSKIDIVKEEYVIRKSEMMQYLDIIKYLNKSNLGNTCSLCLTNNVTLYFNPCGHTACDECYKKLLGNTLENTQELKCAFCRKDVYDTKKLYYI
jgi:hypothetical protein